MRDNRWLTLLVVTVALCVKALLPTGYMPASGTHTITVSICADATGGTQLRQISIPEKGENGASEHGSSKACNFAGHAATALGGADPILLALAIAFVMALAFAIFAQPPFRAIERLLPPLRGPPTVA